MKSSFSIARVFGIDIKVDMSWFLAFGLLLWSFGRYYFPAMLPDLSSMDIWTLALAVTVFLSVSVAAHELGHSLISIKLGVPVQEITLFVFGGVAQIGHEPHRARDELSIALAGPAVRLALALAFGALGWAGAEVVGAKLAAFGSWVGKANLWLMAFNLIPGLPLDGGRVLRAILWGLTGKFVRATRIAGGLGQAVAMGLMAWGVMGIMGGDLANGLWLVFIGWFLHDAAARSVANVLLREVLASVKAQDVMATDCPVVSSTLTLDRLVKEIALPARRQCFPVVGGNRVTGMITMSNIQAVPRRAWETTTVGTAMKPIDDLRGVPPGAAAREVLEQMIESNLYQIPVIEDGKWRGVVTIDRIQARLRLHPPLGK